MKVRIAKFIASTGVASRRDAERMIEQGRITVNGEIISSPVFFVTGDEKILLDGKPIAQKTETKLYIFNKPINTMTTARDPDGRRTIYDALPPEYKGLKYVGRLDYKTTGLLLLTNDGELSRKLTLPSSNIPRTYIATVVGSDFSNLDAARAGITVDGIKYRRMKIEQTGTSTLRVTVTEGKKNEVRIILAAIGLPVKKLHRISFGNLTLGNISDGEIVEVSQKRIDELKKYF